MMVYIPTAAQPYTVAILKSVQRGMAIVGPGSHATWKRRLQGIWQPQGIQYTICVARLPGGRANGVYLFQLGPSTFDCYNDDDDS